MRSGAPGARSPSHPARGFLAGSLQEIPGDAEPFAGHHADITSGRPTACCSDMNARAASPLSGVLWMQPSSLHAGTMIEHDIVNTCGSALAA
jgi:hypothetical protein